MKKVFAGFGNLIYLAAPYWKYGKLYFVLRIAIPVFLAPSIALVQVSLVQVVIDTISGGAEMGYALFVTAQRVFLLFGLTAIRLSLIFLYERHKEAEIHVKINRSIFEKAIKTDYKYFDNPDFYNTFTFAVSELASKSESAMILITEIIGVVSVIAAMTAYLSELGPLVIVITVLGQAASLYAQRLIQKLSLKRTTESLPFDRRLSYVHRTAYQKQYAADLKSSALAEMLISIFDKSGTDKVNVYKRFAKPTAGANLFNSGAWYLCQLAQLAYLIVRVYTKNLGVGTIAGMFTAAARLNEYINQFVYISGRMMELILYAEKIREFFTVHSEIEPQESGVEPHSGAFSVELRDVSFSYPNSDFALKNLNLSIAPGEKIAIVGENGAGKSTLAKLLLRLYDADGGAILYNGIAVREYNVHKLRRKIGVAYQEVQLYALTVRQGLMFYNSASDGVLYELLKKVGLKTSLDSELTREFDDTGIILSGGQSQKLGLTRLMHGSFGLLLLDEPSSALDPLAEYEMTRLIFEQSNTTTIMVAHRLSTIRNADKIFLVDNGTVAESGTHIELMALGGKYAEMFTKQAENYVS